MQHWRGGGGEGGGKKLKKAGKFGREASPLLPHPACSLHSIKSIIWTYVGDSMLSKIMSPMVRAWGKGRTIEIICDRPHNSV